MEDYRCSLLPNSLKNNFIGHKDNVKCVTFVGEQGSFIASGSRYDMDCFMRAMIDQLVIMQSKYGIQMVPIKVEGAFPH